MSLLKCQKQGLGNMHEKVSEDSVGQIMHRDPEISAEVVMAIGVQGP